MNLVEASLEQIFFQRGPLNFNFSTDNRKIKEKQIKPDWVWKVKLILFIFRMQLVGIKVESSSQKMFTNFVLLIDVQVELRNLELKLKCNETAGRVENASNSMKHHLNRTNHQSNQFKTSSI